MSDKDAEVKIDLVKDRGENSRIIADRQIEEALTDVESVPPPRAISTKNKRMIKWGGAAAAMLGLVYLVYYLFAPLQSTMAYGICRVFLERQVLYPQSVRISSVEEFENSVRIWFVQTNSFGEYRLEPVQCYYRTDPQTGSALERVTISRREIDPATVTAFNKTLPAVLAFPPDLSIPDPLPDKLQDLTIETDKFRKPVLAK